MYIYAFPDCDLGGGGENGNYFSSYPYISAQGCSSTGQHWKGQRGSSSSIRACIPPGEAALWDSGVGTRCWMATAPRSHVVLLVYLSLLSLACVSGMVPASSPALR